MARGVAPGMKRCAGEVVGIKCPHGEVTSPPRIVWAAVEVQSLDAWERGDYESWARRVLLLPEGCRWAGEQILWHASDGPQRGELWVVVVSRAVVTDGAGVA